MELLIAPKAQRDLKKLPKDIQPRVALAIDRLQKDPFPPGCTKLTDQPGFRIRVGRFRILYIMDVKNKTVVITHIAHRRDIYQR